MTFMSFMSFTSLKSLMAIIRKNYPVYLSGIALGLLTSIALQQNLEAALWPHKAALEVLYNYHFTFIPELGYLHSQGLFAIAGNCLGTNLFISLFLIYVFAFSHIYEQTITKFVMLAAHYLFLLATAFILTVFRICASIPFCGLEEFTLIHNIISLVVYFSGSFIVYTIFVKRRNAKCQNC